MAAPIKSYKHDPIPSPFVILHESTNFSGWDPQ